MTKTISTCRELCLCTSASSPRRALTLSPFSTTSQTVTDAETTPLQVFLATSMLATDVDTQDAKGDAKLEVRTGRAGKLQARRLTRIWPLCRK